MNFPPIFSLIQVLGMECILFIFKLESLLWFYIILFHPLLRHLPLQAVDISALLATCGGGRGSALTLSSSHCSVAQEKGRGEKFLLCLPTMRCGALYAGFDASQHNVAQVLFVAE